MNIASVLARKGPKIVTVRPEQTIRQALVLLSEHSIGALVVVDDEGRVVGILSERDIVREAARNGSSGASSWAVIGTNKPDAAETVACMMEDLAASRTLAPVDPDPDAIERLVHDRQPRCLSYADWRRLDAIETARGHPYGRPRVKFTSVDEMLAALGRACGEPSRP